MGTMNQEQIGRGRQNFKIIHDLIIAKGQNTIAGCIGTSEPTMSRIVSQLQHITDTLAVIGLKVVPSHLECYSQEYIHSLENIAEEHFTLKRRLKEGGQYKPPLEFPEDPE